MSKTKYSFGFRDSTGNICLPLVFLPFAIGFSHHLALKGTTAVTNSITTVAMSMKRELSTGSDLADAGASKKRSFEPVSWYL